MRLSAKTEAALRICASIPLWVIFIALRTLLIAIGWIVIPLAAYLGRYELRLDGNLHFTDRWMWLWDNIEDGIANDTYYKAPSVPLQIIYWSAVRNPVNNLRAVPWLSCSVDPGRIRYLGSEDYIWNYDKPREQWFFCWQGLYSCIWIQWQMRGRLWRFWLGWKLYPTDIFGVTPYRKDGAGFALQFKIVD